MAVASINGVLAVPSEFSETALAFPDKVKTALATIRTAKEAARLLRGGDALVRMAKDVNARKEEVNAIQYGRLLVIARLGQMIPPKKRGPKDKIISPDHPAKLFTHDTQTRYRKVTANQKKIDKYRKATDEAEDEKEVMTETGFIRFVGSDGNLRTNQGKGIAEWYTPARYVEAARLAMGDIDLDPASCARAQKVVKAKAYYTQRRSGLTKKWKGRVFLNPPYGKGVIEAFVNKLLESITAGDVTQAILLTNSATDTGWWQSAATAATAICFTASRVPFYSPNGVKASPQTGQTCCYFGDRVGTFTAAFDDIGLILKH